MTDWLDRYWGYETPPANHLPMEVCEIKTKEDFDRWLEQLRPETVESYDDTKFRFTASTSVCRAADDGALAFSVEMTLQQIALNILKERPVKINRYARADLRWRKSPDLTVEPWQRLIYADDGTDVCPATQKPCRVENGWVRIHASAWFGWQEMNVLESGNPADPEIARFRSEYVEERIKFDRDVEEFIFKSADPAMRHLFET